MVLGKITKILRIPVPRSREEMAQLLGNFSKIRVNSQESNREHHKERRSISTDVYKPGTVRTTHSTCACMYCYWYIDMRDTVARQKFLNACHIILRTNIHACVHSHTDTHTHTQILHDPNNIFTHSSYQVSSTVASHLLILLSSYPLILSNTDTIGLFKASKYKPMMNETRILLNTCWRRDCVLISQITGTS